MLHHKYNCSLAWAMDSCIMCSGIISSCQSAATSEIVNRSLVCVRHGAALPLPSSSSIHVNSSVQFLPLVFVC